MRRRLFKGLTSLAFMFPFYASFHAQVSGYSFSQSSDVFTPISGGTQIGVATANTSGGSLDVTLYQNQPLDFAFLFNGTSYNAINVSCDGNITFGTQTSNASLPISSTLTYAGAVAAWGRDINGFFDISGFTSDIRMETVGTAPNREIVIQWKNFRPVYSISTTNVFSFDFQVRLVETSNVIKVVYGASEFLVGSTAITGSLTTGPQVGLRGATNSDFNNRTGASWLTSEPGTANGNRMAFSTTDNFPPSGLTFIWSPPACPAPGGLALIDVTNSTADVSWSLVPSASDYTVEWGLPGFIPGTGAELGSVTIPGNSIQLTGLTPQTTYQVYVISDCGVSGFSDWAGPLNVMTTQIPVSSFPWLEDFEDGASEWAIMNGAAVNKWHVGEATNNGGDNGLYVSNDGGLSNTFTVTTYSVVHAYRDIQFPATGGEISLSFDWRAQGESCCDYLQAWLVPTSFVPTPGTAFANNITATGTAPDGRINLSGNLNMQAEYTTFNTVIPAVYFGQTARLIFQWRNDGSVGTQPPGAIDNVLIQVTNCLSPSAISISEITTTTAEVSWTQGDLASSWEIEYGPVGFTLGTGTTIVTNQIPTSIEGLDPATQYQVYIRTDCGDDTYSSWAGPVGFTTDFGCGSLFFDNGGLTGNYLPNSNEVYTICAEEEDSYVQVTFTSFDVEASWDGLYVFDGSDVNAPMIASENAAGFGALTQPGAWWGTSIPGPFVSTNEEGCLTFWFISDGVLQFAGWEATIECLPCTPNAGTDGEVDVCRLDGTLDLNEVITAGEDFGVWHFNANPSLLNGSSLNIAGLPSGTYQAFYIVSTACTSDTTVATVNVFPPSSAGNSGVIVTCNFGPMNLFDGLSGNVDLGGTWYDPAGNALSGALVIFNGQIAANYNYYYITSNGVCPADTGFVEVQLQNCASVIENELQGFEVYPNPTSDVVFVQYTGAPMTADFMLTDAKGAVIFAEKKTISVESAYEMDLSKLERGVYFLNIFGSEGSKVIKVVRN
jgi:hypothetical protein